MTAQATAQAVAEKLEVEMKEFRALRDETAKLANARNTVVTQLQENEMVKKELDLLEPTANVYKLTGPALLKQDVGDAKTNVDGRITMLKAEMTRLEKNIADVEKKQEEKKKRVMEMQALAQRLQAEIQKGAK